MASRIPLELYRPIVECVSDRRTLLSLALSSQDLNVEAERVLYRTINNVHDVQSYTHILRHLTSCPRVARLVRHIHFILRSYVGDDHEFWQLLPTALRSLPNLKTLVFRGVGECRAAQLPSDCAFQLEYLDWWCPSSDVSSFLASQRHLKTVSQSPVLGTAANGYSL
ncbi:hypothetical protein BDZ89DRAFT_699404 [Hymenopellis radicata]|nr:hypothetical protein BDZ89DRAFT_699404 [Hymenopellis radicata]